MTARSAKPSSRLEVATATSIGRLRTNNEDASLLASPLFAVADGMGGHEAGEIASKLAIEALKASKEDLSVPVNLRNIVMQANTTVMDAPGMGIGRVGMGTTLTVAVVDNDRLLVAQIGDSRAYLLHADKLQRLTRDHSYVQELVNAGEITEAETRGHPRRGVITRVLGFEQQAQPDLYEIKLVEGDRILLCTDGLHGMLEDPDIERVMVEQRTAQQCATLLVRAADKAGGADNTTVVVVDVMNIVPPRRSWLASLGIQFRSNNLQNNASQTGNRISQRFKPNLRSKVIAFLLAFVLLVGATATGVYIHAKNSTYLIAENGQVVIYRGLIGDVFGFRLCWQVENTGIAVGDLTPPLPDRLREGIQLRSLEEAEDLVQQYREQVEKTKP